MTDDESTPEESPYEDHHDALQKGSLYPCHKCGKLRTKEEGGTTFTICDECWDKAHPKSIDTEDKDAQEKAYERGFNDAIKKAEKFCALEPSCGEGFPSTAGEFVPSKYLLAYLRKERP